MSFSPSRPLLVFSWNHTAAGAPYYPEMICKQSTALLKARKPGQESLLLGLFEAGITCKFKNRIRDSQNLVWCWLARQCFGRLSYGLSRWYPIICRRIACASDEAGRRVAIGSHAEGPAIGSLHFDKTCTGLQRNMTGLNIYPYNNVKDCTLQLEKLLRYNEK